MGDIQEDAKKDLYWLIAIVVGIGFLWLFLVPPQTDTENKSTENNQSELKQTQTITEEIKSTNSEYKTKIILKVGQGAKEENPQKEYLEIISSSQNKEAVKISNWTLKGKSKTEETIGKGSYLPYSGQVNPQQTISLNPGDKLVVVTGRSPIGTSFRLNQCTGYFQQFQSFTPQLPESCPYPRDEYLPEYLQNDLNCINYIKTLPKCEFPIAILPSTLSQSCQTHITENINYASCIQEHKNDESFYKNEWRIYLNKEQELWRNSHDIITLYDENGSAIDWVSY